MASNPTTIIDELVAAARGTAFLIIGDRRAAGYFDFSLRGLAGSGIAFLASTLFNIVISIMMDVKEPTGSAMLAVAIIAVVYVAQTGAVALALRQMKRLDGLTPYLVTYHWLVFFVTIISTAMAGVGVEVYSAAAVLLIVAFVVNINIARLIVTLSPGQIVLFIVGQMVGGLVGLLAVGMILSPLLPAVPAV